MRRTIRLFGLGGVRILWILGGARKWHMALLLRLLRWQGVCVSGRPKYISATVWFDGSEPTLISLGDGCVISSNVRILTHDFSVARAMEAAEIQFQGEPRSLRPVRIGRGAFVGTGSILCPGADVGEHAIVGAGSVVRGEVPAYGVVIGNPATVVGDARELGRRAAERMGLL